MRLLVVDSDRSFQEELHNFLLSAGYREIVLSADVEEALRETGQARFDAVILAFEEPLIAAVRRLQRRSPRARIIVLLENGDRTRIDRCRTSTPGEESLRGVDFVIKSTFARNLLSLLQEEG